MKIVLGVIAGCVVGILCIIAIEMAGHLIFPPPPGTDLTDPAQVARIMENVPWAALAFVAAAWFVGALAGSWVANRVANNVLAGWIVALLVLAAGIYTMTTIPHPLWMWAMGILLPLIAGWLAQRLVRAPA